MAKFKAANIRNVKNSKLKQEEPLVYLGENYGEARLLDMILNTCSSDEGKTIDSKNIRAYARAIQYLDLCGFVAIQIEEADNIVAGITLKGVGYFTQLLKDDEEDLADRNAQQGLPELSYR